MAITDSLARFMLNGIDEKLQEFLEKYYLTQKIRSFDVFFPQVNDAIVCFANLKDLTVHRDKSRCG